MPHFEGTSFSDPPIFLAFSERDYTNPRRRDFLAQHGLRLEDLVLVNQVHGAEAATVDSAAKPQGRVQADALVTSAAGPVLGILTADCVPVFFWDKSKKIVGIAHAGWRGLAAGILFQVLQTFRKRFHSDPSAIRTLFGPAIRECCYEVGEEFREFFPQHYKILDSIDFENASGLLRPPAGIHGGQARNDVIARKPKADLPVPARHSAGGRQAGEAIPKPQKGRVDLIGVAAEQLLKEGVLEQNILDSGICTSCRNQRFFSARREGTSERILSVIHIRPGRC